VLRLLGLGPLPGPATGPDAGDLRAARGAGLLGGLTVLGTWQAQPLTWLWLSTVAAHALGEIGPDQAVTPAALSTQAHLGLVPTTLRISGLDAPVPPVWATRSWAALSGLLLGQRPVAVAVQPLKAVVGPDQLDPLALRVLGLNGSEVPARERVGETLRVFVHALAGGGATGAAQVEPGGFFVATAPGVYTVAVALTGGRVQGTVTSRPVQVRVYGVPAAITVSPAQPRIVADGFDQALVTVTARDRFGTPVLDASGDATLDPEGGLVVEDPSTGASTTGAVTLPLAGGEAIFVLGPAASVPASGTVTGAAPSAAAGPEAAVQADVVAGSGGTQSTGAGAGGAQGSAQGGGAGGQGADILHMATVLPVRVEAARPSRLVLTSGLGYVPETDGGDGTVPVTVRVVDQAGYPVSDAGGDAQVQVTGAASVVVTGTGGAQGTQSADIGLAGGSGVFSVRAAGRPAEGAEVTVRATAQGLTGAVLNLSIRRVGPPQAIRPAATALTVPLGALCASGPDAAALTLAGTVTDRAGTPVPYSAALEAVVTGPAATPSVHSTAPAAGWLVSVRSGGNADLAGWQVSVAVQGGTVVHTGTYVLTLRGAGLQPASVEVRVVGTGGADTCTVAGPAGGAG